MPGPTFVDTNVLVYAHDRVDRRQPRAAELLEELWSSRTGVIGTQVLQEFYVVATRKFNPPMSRSTARDVVAAYGTWPVVEVDVALIVAASDLEQRHRLSFWDALIIEAAVRAGCERLVTEDLQTGRRFAGVLIENPFA